MHSKAEELLDKEAGYLETKRVSASGFWLDAYYGTAKAASSVMPTYIPRGLTTGKRNPTFHFDKASSTHFVLCHKLCRAQCPKPEEPQVSTVSSSASTDLAKFSLEVVEHAGLCMFKVTSLASTTLTQGPEMPKCLLPSFCFSVQNL